MNIRLIQKDIADTDYIGHLEKAAVESPDLVCFGELATTGCLYQTGPVESLENVIKSLKPFDFAVMLGLPYRTGKGMFNAYLYHHRGNYQVYHKINLFVPMNENLVYEPGSRPGLFETDTDRLGVAICYDLRFPEVFRRLKAAGATKIFVPAAFPAPRIDDWKRLLLERARENRVHVLGINAVGGDGRNIFGGHSMVIDPEGEIIAEADSDSPANIDIQF